MNLKPGPFCGSMTAPKTEGVSYHDVFQVVCDPARDGCGARSYVYETKEQAITAWNRRADDGA